MYIINHGKVEVSSQVTWSSNIPLPDYNLPHFYFHNTLQFSLWGDFLL